MSLVKNLSSTILFCSTVFLSYAQSSFEKGIPEMKATTTLLPAGWEKEKLSVKELILPVALITYGVISLNNNHLKNINKELNKRIGQNHDYNQFNLDHYLVLTPAGGAFALEAFGIKGKNNFKEKAMIYFISSIFTNAAVYTLKKSIPSLRPDDSNINSFPSGHSAQAFASAEFLRKEYKNISIWYGIAGYTVAAATGYLRMYNNKHWFGDVLAGAGIGIASVKLAYWIYPKVRHWFFKDKANSTGIIPYYSNGVLGIGITHSF